MHQFNLILLLAAGQSLISVNSLWLCPSNLPWSNCCNLLFILETWYNNNCAWDSKLQWVKICENFYKFCFGAGFSSGSFKPFRCSCKYPTYSSKDIHIWWVWMDIHFMNLLYADDLVLTTESKEEVTDMFNRWKEGMEYLEGTENKYWKDNINGDWKIRLERGFRKDDGPCRCCEWGVGANSDVYRV